MKRLSLALLSLLFLGICGCVTAPVVNYTPENQKLKTQVSSLQAQIDQLQLENAQLRVLLQAQAATKKEVRMPNASEIQTALKKAGFYKGIVDGQIGPQTKEAIKKFQQANKINPDGVVGSKTWLVLQKYLDGSGTK